MLDALLRFVPKPLHSAYLGLIAHLPDYAGRLVVAGESCGAVGYLLKKRPGVIVTGAVRHARAAAIAGRMLDHVVASDADVERLPNRSFDAILLCNLEVGLSEAMHWLARLAPKLREQGQVYALFGSPDPAQTLESGATALREQIAACLRETGFDVYLQWPLANPEHPVGTPAALFLMAVSPTYNPVLHARELRAAGQPSSAWHVLELIPPVYLAHAGPRASVGLEKLEVLAAWMNLARGHDTTTLLGRAQDQFYTLTDEWPRMSEPYVAMAACWEATGDADMARRLLRTIQRATPSEPAARELARLQAIPATPEPAEPAVPLWDPARSMRVLFLIHPRPHYGLDVLFDGLCDCLGDARVTDYPWKATLHGGDTLENRHYPCRFNRTSSPRSLAEVCAELRNGAYDFILYGDLEGDLPEGDVNAIFAARGYCPVFLVDALDEMGNFRHRMQQRLGLAEFAGYFKREMCRCVDYGPNAWPLPFAYAGDQGLVTPVLDRSQAFFWAGHRRFGQRRLYLETLEARYGWNLDEKYDQKTYQARIRDSRIGLNCFGMGFDTVRYWELPAQGCMLLSERLPIRIPYNFEDGVHAAFFNDLGDLADKLDYYLAHPARSLEVAEAGRQHFQRYHTNRARAAQLLGRVQAVLFGEDN